MPSMNTYITVQKNTKLHPHWHLLYSITQLTNIFADLKVKSLYIPQ